VQFGSAGDLLLAGRFRDVSNLEWCTYPPDSEEFKKCKPLSTDASTPWLVADYIITTQQSSRRTDVQRAVRGVSHVDLFLCANANCDAVADLQYMQQEPQGSPELGFGFSRIKRTVLGLPLGYMDVDVQGSQSRHDELEKGLTGGPSTHINQVRYQEPRRFDILNAAPMLIDVGEWAKAFKPGWPGLRVGKYYASNFPPGQQCITIISPVHQWMDDHGWDVSHDCGKSSGVYIFSNYLPQAFLWGLSADVQDGYEHNALEPFNTSLLLFHDVLREPPSSLKTSYKKLAEDWDALHAKAWADQPHEKKGDNNRTAWYMQSFGRRLVCDPKSKANKANGARCYATHQISPEDCATEEMCTAAVIGTAPVLLMKVSDAKALTRAQKLVRKGRNTTVYNLTSEYAKNGDYYNWRSGNYSMRHIAVGDTVLLTLARLSQIQPDQALPWCMGNASFQKASKAPYGFPLVKRNGEWVSALSCTLWDELGLGFAHAMNTNHKEQRTTDTPEPVEGLEDFMVHTWVPLNRIHVHGFARYERPTYSALEQAINNTVLAASRRLNAAVALQVSISDPIATWQGGVAALALSVVSVIAIAVGRKDMEETFGRWACHVLRRDSKKPEDYPELVVASKVLVALISGTTISVPAFFTVSSELDARKSNAFPSVVAWIQLPAPGYGNYHVLAAVSQSFSPEKGTAGLVLMICALVVSVLSVLAMVVVSFWDNLSSLRENIRVQLQLLLGAHKLQPGAATSKQPSLMQAEQAAALDQVLQANEKSGLIEFESGQLAS